MRIKDSLAYWIIKNKKQPNEYYTKMYNGSPTWKQYLAGFSDCFRNY